ncbi:MAG: DUF4004 family protein [Acutalibacteraceae bacterium]
MLCYIYDRNNVTEQCYGRRLRMDEDLISKRSCWSATGSPMDALYRWKRMGLIPEGWFLRRSTPSGQETYFHTKQICPRVERIPGKQGARLAGRAGGRSWPGRSRRRPQSGS